MKSFFLKNFCFAIISAVVLFFAALGLKFLDTTKNIYEFESAGKAEIISQISQIVLGNDTLIRTDQEGRSSILVLGIAGPGHRGENLTDTIIILTISADKKSITASSIPRDLYIELPLSQNWSKINAVYAYYDKKGDPRQGIKALAEEVKKISGISVNYYLIADFDAFKKLVDAVGGIDYALSEDLYDPTFPDLGSGYEPLYLKAGAYHLDGDLALKISRSRHTINGDFSRITRQHEIIKLLRQKLEDKKIWNNFFAVSEILNILDGNIKTNITLPELQKLNEIAKNISLTDIKSKIPNTGVETGLLVSAKIGGADVLLPQDPSYEELRKFYQE